MIQKVSYQKLWGVNQNQMRRLLISLLFMVASCSATPISDVSPIISKPSCFSVKDTVDKVFTDRPLASIIERTINPERVSKGIQYFNEYPPISNTLADTMIVFDVGEAKNYLVLFFFKDCYRGYIVWRVQHFREYMNGMNVSVIV